MIMLFHEIYSTYFQTVAKILAEAVEHPLTTGEINAIIQDYAFEESTLNIPESLGMAHWQLLKEDGTTTLRKKPTMPLTILQKRWINAIALDPRIGLFTDQPVVFSDVEPLFFPEDIYVFDKYSDGDPYENPEYELMALECLEFLMQEITEISIEKVDEKMLENLMTWQYNGSKSTIDEFRTLSREMQYEVIDFIKDFTIYEELTANGKEYLLVHGGLGNYYPGKDIEEYSIKELIWDRAEYDIQYFEDTYVVTGHTPTQGILGNPKPGYIYKANHHIAIDCGCNRRNGRLAAVCLDTGREYYVEKS